MLSSSPDIAMCRISSAHMWMRRSRDSRSSTIGRFASRWKYRQSGTSDNTIRRRVEITLRTKGPVIRAEAAAEDKAAAFDLALDKLMAQLRKAADRKRVHRGRTRLLAARRGG